MAVNRYTRHITELDVDTCVRYRFVVSKYLRKLRRRSPTLWREIATLVAAIVFALYLATRLMGARLTIPVSVTVAIAKKASENQG
jgi:hypothetical protein